MAFFLKYSIEKGLMGPLGRVALSLGAGLALALWLVGEKLLLGMDIGNRPLLLMAVLAILSGVQLFSFGLLAELQMRTYHESQGRPIYRVRSTLRGRELGSGLET